MRNRVDMAQVEAATKIRAKYLRALENEEWDLLPGPTFVKTFLRTYAEYLGLDARSLVESYKQRYERPASGDLMPFAQPAGRGSRRLRHRSGGVARWLVPLLAVLGLGLGAFYYLGTRDSRSPARAPVASATPEGARNRRATASVTIVARRRVRVCVEDARGEAIGPLRRLSARERIGPFHGARLAVGFQGGAARLRSDTASVNVRAGRRPVGYEVRGSGRPRRMPSNQVPRCR